MNDINRGSGANAVGATEPRPSEAQVARTMRRRLIIVLVSVGILLAAVIALNSIVKPYFIKQVMAKNANPPQVVTTATAGFSEWQPEVSSVGSLRAVHGVDVTTEVAGLVRGLKFRSGEDVKSGQVLVELNADSDIAQLHSLEAAADLSATAYARDQVQYEVQAISKAQLDADAADLKSRRAQAAAQAALVAKKTLRAPFAGRLGITTVNPGQYLNPGDKVVTLQSVDPIFVDFRLPQQQLSRVSVGQTVRLTTDAFDGKAFEGKITAIDPRVDTATRNFQVEALVSNAESQLIPGMFARVSVIAGNTQRFLTLPQTSISYNPYGATVFTVRKATDSSNTQVAQQTFVTVGPTRGDQVAVLEGIKEGDVVVTTGQLKLKNGTPVILDNRIQPKNDPNPTPQEQ